MNTKKITKAVTAVFAVALLLSGQPVLARGGGGGFGGGRGSDFGGFGGHYDSGTYAGHFDGGAYADHGTVATNDANRYTNTQRDFDGNNITHNDINNINGYDHNHPLYPDNHWWNNHWGPWHYPYRNGYGYVSGIPGVYYAGVPGAVDISPDYDNYDYTEPLVQQYISTDAGQPQQDQSQQVQAQQVQPQQMQPQQMQPGNLQNGNGQLRAVARQVMQNMAAQRNAN